MNLTKVKSTTLVDFFFHYPYKKNIETKENVIPFPYVKKEDVVYNDNSVDYSTYKLVMEKYLEKLCEELNNGNEVKLPNRLGFLQMKKHKINKLLDKIKSHKEGKQIYTKVNHTENHMFYIDWMRTYKEAMFDFKWHWRLKPNRKLLKELYNKAEKDYTFINKFKTGK